MRRGGKRRERRGEETPLLYTDGTQANSAFHPFVIGK